jgi:probable phosphoglycerate mutase
MGPVPTNHVTQLILCRHGESEGNRDRRFGGHGATPLTARGHAQGLAAGRSLVRAGVDLLYCSDLPRAEETAAAIGRITGLQAIATPELRERSVGDLTGLTFQEAQERFPEAYAMLLRREPEACPPGGESVLQCRERAVRFLDRVIAEHAGARIAFVSHYVTVYQLILHILGAKTEGSARVFFQIDNCSLHRFELLQDNVWKVVGLNDISHLESS